MYRCTRKVYRGDTRFSFGPPWRSRVYSTPRGNKYRAIRRDKNKFENGEIYRRHLSDENAWWPKFTRRRPAGIVRPYSFLSSLIGVTINKKPSKTTYEYNRGRYLYVFAFFFRPNIPMIYTKMCFASSYDRACVILFCVFCFQDFGRFDTIFSKSNTKILSTKNSRKTRKLSYRNITLPVT